ncbi:TonB-dependent receptor [Flavisphingomonas formosensis]|uniref:TonB-dependent receptor n=1 Tax=Flavisphingomonas formosensis TaxID=861534 RepID=UPI0012FADCD3|nr:TonB-dependent receptor [Sphingomonas formosensis]
MIVRHRFGLLLAGVSMLVVPALARAADAEGVGEIIVTAQKRAERLSDVPISITAASGEQLREQNITASNGLAKAVPNLTVTDYGNPTTTFFTLRGVSQFDFSDHQESPVAVFSDGSYIPYLGAIGANLFDLERVEVLRGPQGTLFGRNATGGVIQLVSVKPTAELSGYGQFSYGNYNAVRAEGAISGPIGGGVLARLSVVKDSHDGYYKNLAESGRKGDGNNVSARGQLYKDFGDGNDVSLITRYSHDKVSTIPARASASYPDPKTGLYVSGNGAEFAAFCSSYFGTTVGADATDCVSGDVETGNPYDISHNRRGGGLDRTTYGGTLTINLKLADTVTLTALTTYDRLKKDYENEDSDATSADILAFNQYARSRDIAQELRIAGKQDWGQWLVGAYYLSIKGRYSSGFSFFPSDPTSSALIANHWTLDNDAYAIFGQGEWKVAPGLRLIGGLRYTWDRKRFDYRASCSGEGCVPFGMDDPSIVQGTGYYEGIAGARPDRKSGNWDGKIQLSYEPSKDLLVYAGISRGTKAGGFNAGTVASYTVAQTRYNDEVLTSYEAGFKASLADRRIAVNGSVFYYDYDGVQLYSQVGTSTLTFNSNARIYGAELEVNALVARGLTVGASASLLNTLTDPIEIANPLTGEVTRERQRMPNAPGGTLTGYVRKEWTIGTYKLITQADTRWISGQKLNIIDYPATHQGAYALVNARIAFGPENDAWEIAAYVQNIGAVTYRIAANPFATTNGSVVSIYGPPRLFGASVRVKF